MSLGREAQAFQKVYSEEEDQEEEEDSEEFDLEELQGHTSGKAKPIVNFWDDEDRGYYPETVPRKCHDAAWLLIYLLSAALFGVVSYSSIDHNLLAHRVWVARDYKFQQCGTGNNDGKPYLFFCLDAYFQHAYLMDDKQVDTHYPICVADCPNSWATTIQCPAGNNTFKILPTYETHPVQGICEPTQGTAGNKIFRAIMLYYFNHRFLYGLAMLLSRSWLLVIGTGAGALCLAVLYVIFVARYARQIIWTGLSAICLLPLGVSLHLFYCSKTGTCGGPAQPEHQVEGYVLLAVALLLAYCICRASAEIEKAIICMSWFGKCVSSVASLKFAPFLRAVSECLIIAFHTYLILCIWSMPPNELDEKKPVDEAAFILGREGCTAVAVLMLIWHIGIVHQVNNVALIYAVQCWFFQGGLASPKRLAPSILRGYWIVVRYHLGSCVFAGLVTKLVVPIRFPLKVLTSVLRWERNPLGMILRLCFGWVEECFFNNLEGLSSHSLYDVVLQANSWCHAVKHSTAIVHEEGGVGHILEGATWIFELAGIATFALVAYNNAQLVLHSAETYSDPMSDNFIALPFVTSNMCLVAGVLCSYPFMDMFRLVSDCILYCRTVEKQRKQIPASQGEGFDPAMVGGCTDELAGTLQRLLCMDGRQRGRR